MHNWPAPVTFSDYPAFGRDLVVFAGAGFSVPAGEPTMRQFAEFSAEQLKVIRSRHASGANPRRDALKFVEAAETYHEFLEYLTKSSPPGENAYWDLEKVFSTAETLRAADVPAIALQGRHRSCDYIYDQIRLWLWKIYQTLPLIPGAHAYAPERKCNPDAYSDFITALRNASVYKRSTFITTNYDMVIDFLCASMEGIAYPFQQFHRLDMGGSDILCGNTRGERLLVCKLHGSINYFRDITGSTEHLLVADQCGPGLVGLSGHIPAKRPMILAFDALNELRARYGVEFLPELVPPTYAKLATAAWLKQTWNIAYGALSRATRVIFAGYSLPRSDGAIEALLRCTGVGTKSSAIVVNPCEGDEVHRYEQVLGKNIKFVSKRFDEISLEDWTSYFTAPAAN